MFAELSAAWDAEDGCAAADGAALTPIISGQGDFHLDPLGRVSRRGRAGALYLYRHPDRLAPAARCAEGAFSTNILWNRAMPRGAFMACPYRRVVRGGHAQSIAPTEKPLWRGRAARGPRLYSIAAHRGFADALVAGLIPRYADPDLGLAPDAVAAQPARRAHLTEAFVRAGTDRAWGPAAAAHGGGGRS
jgi:hypothetical protein